LYGTGEIPLESADRALRILHNPPDAPTSVNARTAGVYWRADPEALNILTEATTTAQAELIAEQPKRWKSISTPTSIRWENVSRSIQRQRNASRHCSSHRGRVID
jgi:hypothetical protein